MTVSMKVAIESASAEPTAAVGAVPSSTPGLVFDVQRYSLHDGPGIRTTAFLKGCPLHCPWCHNPESQSAVPEIVIAEDRCIHSGACGLACPNGLAGGPFAPDPERCERCGRCADACPSGARRLIGRRMTAAEVIAVAERDRPFYDESGGGVTFSGGEPLMQPDFLLACLAEAKARGLHAVVDTCGAAPPAVVREVAALADLFLFDLKVVDPVRHRELTGWRAEPILANLRLLDDLGAEVWLRLPLVPGYTDGSNLEAIAGLARGLRNIRRLHLLPYHRLGADKRARQPRGDLLADVQPPGDAEVRRAAELMVAAGLEVHLGG
jgi:pyruvate formate lyase activating enzyme